MGVSVGQISFASNDITVVADLGDGLPIQTQGFGGWQEIERPRRKSLTTWKGRQPWRITIPIIFDRLDQGDWGLSVETELRNLEKLAGGGIQGEPPVLIVDSAGVVPHDFHDAPHVRWVLDGVEFGDTIRNPHGNRVRCELVVTVLEYVEDKHLAERSAANKARDKDRAKKPGAKNKKYTVKKGDTLSKIARKQLGDAGRWREIGRLNNIRDPRNVHPGQVLRLP